MEGREGEAVKRVGRGAEKKSITPQRQKVGKTWQHKKRPFFRRRRRLKVSVPARGGRTDCPVLSPEKVGERREIPLKRHKRERRKVERREQDIFVTLKSGENEEVEKVPFSSPFPGVGAVARSRAPPPPP